MGTKPVGTNQEHKTEAFVNRKGCGVRERARNECDKRPSSPCKVASCAFLLLTLLGRISNGASMNHLKLCSAFALSLATSLIVADVALAQELSLLEGFEQRQLLRERDVGDNERGRERQRKRRAQFQMVHGSPI